ncbi:unnamed protein product [Clonostachys rhizophaga]|uniref:Major facilitator superfamily (MFS) profile domain-containing protein n=1 Tax=Clonostachys rhizophaga TaxID=160324 RepID=A0A9N9VPI0_9HYPO|nr:unnamed protein product [Clonostachys rhizophaga]
MDQMDRAPTLLEKLKFFLIVGVGYFANGYTSVTIVLGTEEYIPSMFYINQLVGVSMLGYIYFEDTGSAVPTDQSSTMKTGTYIGLIVGQLVFGYLGDTFGRNSVYGKELIFFILGNIMCILMPWRGFSHSAVVGWMTTWRAVMGLGTGGDIPISATLSAEKSGTKGHAHMFLLVYFIGGVGNITASIVLVILLAAFKKSIQDNVYHFNWVWRLHLGLNVGKNQNENSALPAKPSLRSQFQTFIVFFKDPRHAKTLFAATLFWFLQIGFGKGETQYVTMWNTAVGNCIVYCAGYLPGLFIGTHILPYVIGRRAHLFYSASLLAVIYAVWAGVSNIANTGTLMSLFVLAQAVMDSGPALVEYAFLELFPTRVRATAFGIASSSGRLASIIAVFGFTKLENAIGLGGILGFFAGIMALAALCVGWIPETRNCTIDDIEKDFLYRPELRDNSGEQNKEGRGSDKPVATVVTEEIQA